MKDFYRRLIQEVSKKTKLWRSTVMTLAAIVVFTTTYALILPALSMDVVVAQQDAGIGLENENTADFSSGAQEGADTGTASAEQNTDTGEAQTPTAADTDSAATGTEPDADDDFSTDEPAVVEQQTTADAAASTLTAEIPGATITLAFDAEAGVPEGTILTVTALTQEEAGAYRNAAQEKADASVSGSTVTTAQFYRLALTHDGETVTLDGDADIHVGYTQNLYLEQDETAYAVVYTGEASSYHTLLLSRNSDGTATVTANNGAITAADLKDYSISRYGDVFGIVSVKAPAAENGDEAGADDTAAADAIEDTAVEAEKNSKETVDAADDIDTEKVNDNLATEEETQGTDAAAEEENIAEDEEAVEDKDAVEEKNSVEGEAAAEDKEAAEDQNAAGDAAEAENTIADENAAEEKDPAEAKDISEGEDAAEEEVAAAADETDAQDADPQDTKKESEDFDAPESLTEEDAQAGLSELDLGDVVIRPVDEELLLPADTEGHAEVLEGTDADEAQTAVEDYVNAQNALKASKMKKAARRQTLAATTATADQSEQAYQVFDIALENVDAEEYKGGFEVEVSLPENVIGKDFHLYHIHDGETEEIAVDLDERVLDEESGVSVVSGFTFETANFSEFVLKYTVDFEYNGYTFSMPGGGVLLLSELFEALEIDEDVSNVEKVTFTDYSLLSIGKATSDRTYESLMAEYLFNGEYATIDPESEAVDKDSSYDRIVRTGDWTLKSLQPFASDEILTVQVVDGDTYLIHVTDLQATAPNGSSGWDISNASNAGVNASVNSSVTSTEQERNVKFDVSITYNVTTEALDEMKASSGNPVLFYNFSSAISGSPAVSEVEEVIDAPLAVGTRQVGTYSIINNCAYITITDKSWLANRSNLSGSFEFSIQTDETKINSDDEWSFNFPGDSDSITIHYKKTVEEGSKTCWANKDENGDYILSYTAIVNVNSAQDTLRFVDTMTGEQNLVDGSVTVNGTAVSTFVSKSDKAFTFDVPTALGTATVAPGQYKVEYKTKVTKDKFVSETSGTLTEYNKAMWTVSGNKTVPGGETTITINKELPDIPFQKSVTPDTTSDWSTSGQELTYTITVGEAGKSLAGLHVKDCMTDIQTLDGTITVSAPSGWSATIPSNWNNDGQYSQWNDTDVFDYTFPSDAGNGPATITYSTKVIDQETAKSSGIYGRVDVNNKAELVGRNKWSSTQGHVPFAEEKKVTVTKSAATVLNGEKWQAGETVTYTLTIGDSETLLDNMRIYDVMTDIQTMDASSLVLKKSDNSSVTQVYVGGQLVSLANSVKTEATDQTFSTNSITAFDFIIPAGTGNGPLTITYNTELATESQAKGSNIFGNIYANNEGHGGNGSGSTGGTIGYPGPPTMEVDKTYSIESGATDGVDNSVQPGGIVHYTATYGWDKEKNMDKVIIKDEMTDIQKLVVDGTHKVTVTLEKAPTADLVVNGRTVLTVDQWNAGTHSFEMPLATGQYETNGYSWPFFDDDAYNVSNYVRVYWFELPEGIGNQKVSVDYYAQIISAEEAKEAGITNDQLARNKAYAENVSDETEVTVPFEKEVEHKPKISKVFDHWDIANNKIYWKLRIERCADSAYPLENLTVAETNAGYTDPEDSSYKILMIDGVDGYNYWSLTGSAISLSLFDVVNAKVETDSGVELQIGEDYTVDKSNAAFHFDSISEGITITLSFDTPLNSQGQQINISDQFKMKNTAYVRTDTDIDYADAEVKYEPTEVTVTKNGTYDETSRIITWTVRLNPNKAKLDLEHDIFELDFEDIIPDGLEIVNYSSPLDNTKEPTINVGFTNKGTGTIKYTLDQLNGKTLSNGKLVGKDYYNSNSDGIIFIEGNSWEVPVTQSGNTISQQIIPLHTNDDINNRPDKNTSLSLQEYIITYKTKISDAEWNHITSSATGSKTYTNSVEFKDKGDQSFETETNVTVTSENYISKTDVTRYDANGVIVDENGKESNIISYSVEINPNGYVINGGKDLTLTDNIPSNMELLTASGKISIKATINGSEVELVGNESYPDVSISYNDDARMMTISGLPDSTPMVVTFGCAVRAQGEDTFTNTATLIGGGSHSDTVTKKHKVQTHSATIGGDSNTIQLHKIDENNVSVEIEGAKFKLYKANLQNLTTETRSELYTAFDANSDGWIDSVNLNNFSQTGLTPVLNGSNDTFTSDDKGYVAFPNGLEEETIYCWVETETIDGYSAELNVPHYFVIYSEKTGTGWDTLTDEQKLAYQTEHKHHAWALDTAFEKANNATVASVPFDMTWTVTNIKDTFTSITVEKKWEGDYNDLYDTRPTEGIKLNLYQIDKDGNETLVSDRSPIVVRADENGRWPKFTWAKLPAKDASGNKYKYTVKEEPVDGYSTIYSDGGEGKEYGDITVTNTMIPKKTNIYVKKVFVQPESAEMPDQILVDLYSITTPKDEGLEIRRYTGFSAALTAENNWSYEFKNLPTTSDIGSITYTVVEKLDRLTAAGFKYTVTYSDNGEGIISSTENDPLVIRNVLDAKADLVIKKTFDGEVTLTTEQKNQIRFTVKNPSGQTQNISYSDFDENGEYKFEDVPVGTYEVTETNADFPGLYRTTVYKVDTDPTEEGSSVTFAMALEGSTVSFTNTYSDHTDIDTTKVWDDQGEESEHPAIQITLLQSVDGAAPTTVTGNDKSGNAIENPKTIAANATGESLIVHWTNLPVVDSNGKKITYSVSEEKVTGYLNPIITGTEADGFTITNKKDVGKEIHVQKVWQDTDQSFRPSSITVKLQKKVGDGEFSDTGDKLVLTATNGWEGDFTKLPIEEDGSSITYKVVELGVGGYTTSYSGNDAVFTENDSTKTVTVTNTRTETQPDTTHVSVQKKWTVNGEEADTSSWDPVEVKLVRYKALKPVSNAIIHFYKLTKVDNTPVISKWVDLSVDKVSNCKIVFTTGSEYNTNNNPANVNLFNTLPTNTNDWWYYQHNDCLTYSENIGSWMLDLTQYSGNEFYAVLYSYNFNNVSGITNVANNTPGNNNNSDAEEFTLDLSYTVENVVLNDDNAWQYDFTDLPTEAGNYLYKYTVVETDTSKQVSRVVTGGESIDLGNSQSEAVGGNVVIANNKVVKGSVKVTKSFSGIIESQIPANFKITALWTDGEAQTAELTATGDQPTGVTREGTFPNYTWTISDLPLDTVVTFTESGYNVDGYTVEVAGSGTAADKTVATATAATDPETASFVNTYTGLTSISVTKSWKDVSTNATTVPTGATATLGLYTRITSGDPAVETLAKYPGDANQLTVTLNGTAVSDPNSSDAYGYAEEAWKATWKNLPKYDASGHQITYVAKEESTTPSGLTFKAIYDGNDSATYATTSVENQYTSFRLQKRWMKDQNNQKVWYPDYSVSAIYYKLAKINGTDKSTITIVDDTLRTLTASTTLSVATVDLGDDSTLVQNKYPDTDNDGYYVIPFADEITPLKVLDSGWNYCAVECKSDGTSLTTDTEFWTCNEFNGTVFAIKNDLTDVKATKTWNLKNHTGVTTPEVKLTLYKTTDTIPDGSWDNATGYDSLNGITWTQIGTFQTIPAGAAGDQLTVTWSDLPKYDIATGAKITYYVKEETVPEGYMLTGRGLVGGNEYQFSFENSLDETEFSVTKVWTTNSGNNEKWHQDDSTNKSITLKLERYMKYTPTGDTEKEGKDNWGAEFTVNGDVATGSIAGTTYSYTLTYDASTETYLYTFRGLEKRGSLTVSGTSYSGDWIYKVSETTALAGYNSPKYYDVEGSIVGGGTEVETGGKIVNDKSTVSLPATGGLGARLYHVFGLTMILFAGAMLLIKRKSGLELIPENK